MLRVLESGSDDQSSEIWINVAPPGPAGSIEGPDGRAEPALRVEIDESIRLDWGESCNLDDSDFAVFVGPHNEESLGSLGVTSTGVERGPGSGPDGGLTLNVAACR